MFRSVKGARGVSLRKGLDEPLKLLKLKKLNLRPFNFIAHSCVECGAAGLIELVWTCVAQECG